MREPESLKSLIDLGIIQEVVRPLMSGKEAQVYLVVSEDQLSVAKVFKAAQKRSFRQRAEYTEGRSVRNTRTQRAMNKRSTYGRAQDEASWRNAEAEIVYRLQAAGVRVPQPLHFIDGVLVMELITDARGNPAPRLADVELETAEAKMVFSFLLSSVVKMLCAGVVHGDLSEFNVLMGHDGPVLIDFPQAVDPAHNRNARQLLIRDIDNLHQVLTRGTPRRRRLPYGQELWELYTRGELTPETELTGRYQQSKRKADTSGVLHEIEDANRDAERRGATQGRPGRRRRRRGRGGAQQNPVPAVTGQATDKPRSDKPRSNEPRSDKPRSNEPRSDKPRSDKPRPNEPRSDKPRPGRRRSRKPRSDQPRSDQPRSDQPRSNQPRSDQPRSNQPRSNQPRSDQPRSDQPRSDQPRSDRPQSDKPRSGRRRSGRRRSGGPRSDGPQSGKPKSDKPQSG